MSTKTKVELDLTKAVQLLADYTAGDEPKLNETHNYIAFCHTVSNLLARTLVECSDVVQEWVPSPKGNLFFTTLSDSNVYYDSSWQVMMDQVEQYRFADEMPTNKEWQKKNVLWNVYDKLILHDGASLDFYLVRAKGGSGEILMVLFTDGTVKVALDFSLYAMKSGVVHFSNFLKNPSSSIYYSIPFISPILSSIWAQVSAHATKDSQIEL